MSDYCVFCIQVSNYSSGFIRSPASDSMPTVIYTFTIALIPTGYVFIIGGNPGGSVPLNTIYIYDINNDNLFLSVNTLPVNAKSLGCAYHQITHRIWCFAGSDGNLTDYVYYSDSIEPLSVIKSHMICFIQYYIFLLFLEQIVLLYFQQIILHLCLLLYLQSIQLQIL